MNKQLLTIGALSIGVLVLLTGWYYYSRSNSTIAKKINFEKLDVNANGSESSILDESNQLVIASVSDIEKYSLQFLNINNNDYFNDKIIIAATMGMKPNSGYAIEIKQIDEYKDKIVVQVVNISPANDCINAQVISFPADFVTIKKTSKQIVFNTKEEERSCSR